MDNIISQSVNREFVDAIGKAWNQQVEHDERDRRTQRRNDRRNGEKKSKDSHAAETRSKEAVRQNQVTQNSRYVKKGQVQTGQRRHIEEGTKVVMSTDKQEKRVKTTESKRMIEKDVLTTSQRETKSDTEMKLDLLKSSDDIFMKYLTTHEESTIALLGKMAVLIAQTDTNFRQLLWDQSTQTIHMNLQMAQNLKQLVQDQWKAQSEATMCDAEKEQGGGIGMLVGSGISIAMGGAMAMGEEKELAAKAGDQLNGAQQKTADVLGKELANKAAQAGQGQAGQGAVADAAKLADNAKPFDKLSSLTQVNKYMTKIMGAMQSTHMAAQGGIQLANDAPNDRAKARCQLDAGKNDGLAKETEGYQAWGNQVTERGNQGVNAADQNHATTIQTWKSASDSYTNALVSAWNKL